MGDVADKRDDDTIGDLLIGLLYVVAVGVQVFVVVDELTSGALSDEVQRRWRTVTAEAREARRIERELRDMLPEVQYQAWQITKDAAPS